MSLTDYSQLEGQIKDAPEPIILPKGTEVKARIIAVREGVSDKNECQWYQPVFDVPSEPLAQEFNDFFWGLEDLVKLDEKSQARALRKFRIFAEAIGLDYSKPFSWTDDLTGSECWVILGIQKDDEYGDKNTVKKYVLGQ